MLFDAQRAWFELRGYVQQKSGHGTFGSGGLLAKMAELELECALEEGPTERMLRLFDVQVSEGLLQIVEAASGEGPSGAQLSEGDHSDSKGAYSDTHRDSEPSRR